MSPPPRQPRGTWTLSLGKPSLPWEPLTGQTQTGSTDVTKAASCFCHKVTCALGTTRSPPSPPRAVRCEAGGDSSARLLVRSCHVCVVLVFEQFPGSRHPTVTGGGEPGGGPGADRTETLWRSRQWPRARKETQEPGQDTRSWTPTGDALVRPDPLAGVPGPPSPADPQNEADLQPLVPALGSRVQTAPPGTGLLPSRLNSQPRPLEGARGPCHGPAHSPGSTEGSQHSLHRPRGPGGVLAQLRRSKANFLEPLEITAFHAFSESVFLLHPL